MATGYTFARTGNTTKVVHITDDVVDKVDGFTGPVHVENINATSWQITAGSGVSLSFTKASIITIDGEAPAGTLSGLMDQLIAVFPDASSGGGDINFTAVADDTWDGFNELEMSAPTTLTIDGATSGLLIVNKTGTDDLSVQKSDGDPEVIPTNDNGLSILSYVTNSDGDHLVEGSDGSITLLQTAVGGGYDADAQTAIDAIEATDAGALTTDQKDTVNARIVALKAQSKWTNMVAYYGYVGGTAAAHAINWRNPGTFNITWGGTVTHNANGITGDGSSGKGVTGINPSTHLTSVDEVTIGGYSRTSSATGFMMGCTDVTSSGIYLVDQTGSGGMETRINTGVGLTGTATPTKLLIAARQNTAPRLSMYRDGSSFSTNGSSGVALPNSNLNLMAYYNSDTLATVGFSDKNYASHFIYDGPFDAADVTQFNTDEVAFQTALSRNV